MSLSLLEITISAVGMSWESFPLAGRKGLPPILQHKILSYMIKNDLVVDRDITPILPVLIMRNDLRKSNHSGNGTDGFIRALSPSLDLSGCKTISERTIAQIASVCPDLQELVTNFLQQRLCTLL